MKLSISRQFLNQKCLYQSFRHLSTADLKTKTHPIEQSAYTIRHLQFVKPLPFQRGLDIQEKFVRAHLDIKQLQSKINKRLLNLQKDHNETIEVNEHERMILESIKQMKPNPIVLTFEFEPTYTGGKRIKKQITQEQIAQYENFQPLNQKDNKPPKFVQVERGGQVTFHGPGQMVAYVIMDLKSFDQFPAKCLVSTIEDAAINALEKVPKLKDSKDQLNLKAIKTDETGVWINQNEKIASIGIHVRRSVTSHGISINVNPDLSYLNSFTMCGLSDKRATSLREKYPSSETTVDDVAVTFVKELAKLLGVETVERIQLDDLAIDEE